LKSSSKIIRHLFGEETRFVTTALFYLLITLISFVVYISIKSYTQELTKAGDNLSYLSLSVQQTVEEKIRNAEMALNEMALYLSIQQNDFDKLDKFKISSHLEKIRKNFYGLEVLAITNKQGLVEANSYWNTKDKYLNRKIIDINDRSYFLEHKLGLNSGLVISDPQISKTMGTPVITVSKRILSNNGEFKGILSTTINLTEFVENFKEVSKSSDMNITLINQKRLVLSRYPLNDKIFGKYISLSENEKIEVQKNKIFGRFQIKSSVDSQEKIVVYKRFEKIPLTVYLGRPLSSVLYDWKRYVLYLWLITSVLIITTCYLLYRFYLENLKFKEQQIEVVNSARMSSIGLMAASIAHEINNPLTIILGRSAKGLKLLNDPVFEFDRETLKMYFSKINDAASRMTKIISGVKVIARDANQDQFDQVWAHDLIEHVTDYLSERYKVHGVELIIEEIPEVVVKCRESQIAQVLVNLLNNAYDAIEDLPEKWIKINFKIVDKKIQIIIMDSGLGISPEIRNKIMSPFFTSKVTSKGTGLGLYISSKILKEHMGELRYDDSYRHTTFVIELPLNQVIVSDN